LKLGKLFILYIGRGKIYYTYTTALYKFNKLTNTETTA